MYFMNKMKAKPKAQEKEAEYVGVTPEFEEMLATIIKRNRKTLETLAKH